jgi:hypothetical protein
MERRTQQGMIEKKKKNKKKEDASHWSSFI